jgi:uncharacterized membrane protein YbhN (UPF0104 family)
MDSNSGTRWSRARALLVAWFSGHYREVTSGGMLAAALLGAGLALGALIGVGLIAGVHDIAHLLQQPSWSWIPVAVGCVVVSHIGYMLAYREVGRVRGGPVVPLRRMGAFVVAGFGMLVPRAGFTLDQGIWRDHGLTDEQARDRVATTSMLEYALLAPAAFIAALVLLVTHYPATQEVLPSWTIGVPAGAAITIALLIYRDRLPRRGRGWTSLQRFLDAIQMMFEMVRTPRGALAASGMAVYWAADIASLGACIAVVQHSMPPVAVLIVGYATGYALTRRSLPLAGAGAAEALMPFAMHWMNMALAVAVLGVFIYRLCNLWLPLAPAIVSLRHLQGAIPARAASGS